MECAEVAVDRLRVWIRRAKNVIPDKHHSASISDATMKYFLIGHPNILAAADAAPIEQYRTSRRAPRCRDAWCDLPSATRGMCARRPQRHGGQVTRTKRYANGDFV